MAYGEKYYHDYCDDEGKAERISILQVDYEGLATRAKGGPVPFVLSYESGSDFKFDPIRPSKATITFLYDDNFNFSEIWEADERTFKVEKWHDGVIQWSGFLIPNGFNHLMKYGLKYAEMEASDGLSLLESIPFLGTDGETYGNMDLVYNDGLWFPFSLIATEILRKLDLDLNTWIAVDVYEESMVKVGDREADPLSQSLVNVKTYINDKTNERIPYWQDIGAAWDCLRVMQNLLFIWGAKLYQEGGAWRIKRVNLDANKTDKFWRVYNTLNVFVAKFPIEPDINIPCNSVTDILVGLDHTIQMDRVFDAVRINYEYAYERDAEESTNMIKNPNFAEQGSESPIHWRRWGRDDVNKINTDYITLDGSQTDGITTAIRINNGGDQRRELQYGEDLPLLADDTIYLEWWERMEGGYISGANLGYTGVYTIYLETTQGVDGGRQSGVVTKNYFLGNNGIVSSSRRTGDKHTSLATQWVEDRVYFFSFPGLLVDEARYIANDYWARIVVKLADLPASGILRIRSHGIAARNPYHQFELYRRQPFPGFYPLGTKWELNESYYTGPDSAVKTMSLTGFFLGVAKDTSSELVPSDHDYIVFNNGEYSDRFEPLEIFNGDAIDESHVSNIMVPTKPDGMLVWNNWEESYTPSSLGLITAYSIMNQYNLPYKMIDGALSVKNIAFGSVITFDSLPGEKFIIQRGSFTDYKRDGNFSGTLVRVIESKFFTGGLDNGNTVEPIWIETGNTRCYKSSRGGVNTGMVEIEQVDINPSSPSQNTKRWIDGEVDLVRCPLDEPSDYFWGSDGVVLDTENLTYYPVGFDTNGVMVKFNNPGGLYLYFLHRVELGVVESIYTPAQDAIIYDWQYLDDEIIGGYSYRTLRMNFPTGQYNDAVITFVFN